MKANMIDFGKEVIENFRLKHPLPSSAIDDAVDFKINGAKLYFVYKDKEYEVVDATSSQQRRIEEIDANSSKVIMRIEAMGRIKATVSILFMLDANEFDGTNPLKIFIDSKLEMDLIKRGIRKDAVKFFVEQFMLKGMCFVR